MPKPRRKISAVVRDFSRELSGLELIDRESQSKFSILKVPASHRVSKTQLHFLTESIFLRAFRAYESFIRDIFLLYCIGKSPPTGKKVVSFINPRNFKHAENLIKSSMRFVDWSNPDAIISRAEIYLRDGYPIKLPITTYRQILIEMERLRNHISHSSNSSLAGYLKVLKKHYRVTPLTIPPPGEFMLVFDKKQKTKYKLNIYFEELRKIASEFT